MKRLFAFAVIFLFLMSTLTIAQLDLLQPPTDSTWEFCSGDKCYTTPIPSPIDTGFLETGYINPTTSFTQDIPFVQGTAELNYVDTVSLVFLFNKNGVPVNTDGTPALLKVVTIRVPKGSTETLFINVGAVEANIQPGDNLDIMAYSVDLNEWKTGRVIYQVTTGDKPGTGIIFNDRTYSPTQITEISYKPEVGRFVGIDDTGQLVLVLPGETTGIDILELFKDLVDYIPEIRTQQSSQEFNNYFAASPFAMLNFGIAGPRTTEGIPHVTDIPADVDIPGPWPVKVGEKEVTEEDALNLLAILLAAARKKQKQVDPKDAAAAIAIILQELHKSGILPPTPQPPPQPPGTPVDSGAGTGAAEPGDEAEPGTPTTPGMDPRLVPFYDFFQRLILWLLFPWAFPSIELNTCECTGTQSVTLACSEPLGFIPASDLGEKPMGGGTGTVSFNPATGEATCAVKVGPKCPGTACLTAEECNAKCKEIATPKSVLSDCKALIEPHCKDLGGSITPSKVGEPVITAKCVKTCAEAKEPKTPEEGDGETPTDTETTPAPEVTPEPEPTPTPTPIPTPEPTPELLCECTLSGGVETSCSVWGPLAYYSSQTGPQAGTYGTTTITTEYDEDGLKKIGAEIKKTTCPSVPKPCKADACTAKCEEEKKEKIDKLLQEYEDKWRSQCRLGFNSGGIQSTSEGQCKETCTATITDTSTEVTPSTEITPETIPMGEEPKKAPPTCGCSFSLNSNFVCSASTQSPYQTFEYTVPVSLGGFRPPVDTVCDESFTDAMCRSQCAANVYAEINAEHDRLKEECIEKAEDELGRPFAVSFAPYRFLPSIATGCS